MVFVWLLYVTRYELIPQAVGEALVRIRVCIVLTGRSKDLCYRGFADVINDNDWGNDSCTK